MVKFRNEYGEITAYLDGDDWRYEYQGIDVTGFCRWWDNQLTGRYFEDDAEKALDKALKEAAADMADDQYWRDVEDGLVRHL